MLINSTQQLQIQVSMVEILHHISEHKGQCYHKLATLIVQLLLLLLHPIYKYYNIYTYIYIYKYIILGEKNIITNLYVIVQ